MKTLSKDELKKKINGGEKFQLIDVRGKECCYDHGHIPGAKSMPLNELETRAPKELNKLEPIIVYCGSFSCSLSPRAAHILKEHMKFEDVSDFEGGYADWKDAGYPIEKSQDI
jgi:rhodanese-related sulfurtransferase